MRTGEEHTEEYDERIRQRIMRMREKQNQEKTGQESKQPDKKQKRRKNDGKSTKYKTNSEPKKIEKEPAKEVKKPENHAGKKKKTTEKRKKRRGWKIFVVFLFILALFAGAVAAGWKALTSTKLEVSFFHLYSEKISSLEGFRAVVLSDLHNSEFGTDNEELVEKVRGLSPDVILIAGDMVNKDDPNTEIAVTLCRQLTEIAPVYYGIGNHEGNMIYESGIRIDGELRDVGVTVLINESVDTEINGTPVSVGSVGTSTLDYDEYSAEFVSEFVQKDEFKILIAHCPDLYYEKMADVNIDLGVCGHYHGGQIQLPVLGGLFSYDHGLFPKYCNGMFQLTNSTIFVSRGLGNSHKVPRINNRPEIAVIDVNSRLDGTARTSQTGKETGN